MLDLGRRNYKSTKYKKISIQIHLSFYHEIHFFPCDAKFWFIDLRSRFAKHFIYTYLEAWNFSKFWTLELNRILLETTTSSLPAGLSVRNTQLLEVSGWERNFFSTLVSSAKEITSFLLKNNLSGPKLLWRLENLKIIFRFFFSYAPCGAILVEVNTK